MSSLRLAIKKSMLDAGLSAPASTRKPKKSSTSTRRPGDPPRKRGRPRKHPLPEEDHNDDDDNASEDEELEFSSSQEDGEEEEEGEVEEEHGFGDEERENDDDEELESLSKPAAVESKSNDDDDGNDDNNDSFCRMGGDTSDSDSQQKKRKKKALKRQNTAATTIQKMIKAKKKSSDATYSGFTDGEEAPVVATDDSDERPKEVEEKLTRPISPKPPNANAPKKSLEKGDGNETAAPQNETKQPLPATKKSKKPGHVPGPPEEVIEWMAKLAPEEARQHITVGLRLKVRFVTKVRKQSGKVVRRLKWFGGLVTAISTGGSRVRIKYDDGTSEVTKFPDKDIIVDDTDNGRHKVPADAFQPPPGDDISDEERFHGDEREDGEKTGNALKEETAVGEEISPEEKLGAETCRKEGPPVMNEDEQHHPGDLQQRNIEKLERRKKKKKKKRLLEKAAIAELATASGVRESSRSPMAYASSEGRSPLDSPGQPDTENPPQEEKSDAFELAAREADRGKALPTEAAEEEEVVVAEIVEDSHAAHDKSNSGETAGAKVLQSVETKKKSTMESAETKARPSLSDVPPVPRDDEVPRHAVKPRLVPAAPKTGPAFSEKCDTVKKKKTVELESEVRLEEENRQTPSDLPGKDKGRSTPVQEETRQELLQTPVAEKRKAFEETVLEDTPVTERRIEPTTAFLVDEQERPKKGKKRKKKRLLEHSRSSSDETYTKKSKTTQDTSATRKVSEESKSTAEADRPVQLMSVDAEFVAPPKKVKKKKRERIISPNLPIENARAANDDDGGENEEIKAATASTKKRKREEGGTRKSPKTSPVDQSPMPQTPNPRGSDSKGSSRLATQNDPNGEIVHSLSTSVNSAFEKKRYKKQKRVKETTGLSTDHYGTPVQQDVVDGDAVSAPRLGRRAAQQANERISSKQEHVIKDTFSKPKKKRGEHSKEKTGRRNKDGEKSDEEEAPAWVQCDHCSKWRVLPSDVDPDTLPKKWFCELNVDMQHNTCDAPEQTAQEVAKARRKEKRRQARMKAQAEAAAANDVSQDEAEPSSEGSKRQRLETAKEGRREKKEGRGKRSRTPVPAAGSDESGGSQTEEDGAAKKTSKKLKTSESDENIAFESGKSSKGSKQRKRSKEGKEEKTKGKGKGRTGSSKDDEDDADNLDWVQCDKCHKWRRLPSHISADDLPDTWYCTMKEWDPENANCNAEEDKADPSHREYNALNAATGGSKLSYRSLIFGTGRKQNRPVSERQRAAESIFARVPLDGSVDYPVVMYANSSVFASKAKDKAEERLGDHTPFLDMMTRSNLWAELQGLNYLMQATTAAVTRVVPLVGSAAVPFTYMSLPVGLKAEMKELVLHALGDKTLTMDELLLEAQGRRWEGVPQTWHELRALCTLQSVGADLRALVNEGRVTEHKNSLLISMFSKTPPRSAPSQSPTSEVAMRNSKCIKIAKPWKRGSFEVTSN